MIDPGRAFGTGAHGSTRAALELLQPPEPLPRSTWAAGRGCCRSRRLLLGFGPLQAFDIDPLAVEPPAATPSATGSRGGRRADVLTDPLPPAPLWLANLELHLLEPLLRRPDCRRRCWSRGCWRQTVGGGERAEVDGWAAELVAGDPHVYRFFARAVGAACRAVGARPPSPDHVLRLRVGDTCEVAWEGRVHRADPRG